MNRRLSVPPRSTLYLSAGLLLLPIAGLAQTAASGWSCQAGPNGTWLCGGAATTTPAPTTSAPTIAAPPNTPAVIPAPAAPATAPKPLPTAIAAASRNAGADDWDYVQLQPGETASAACCGPRQHCNGYYREPARDWQDSDVKPTGLPMRANAAESELQGNIVKMDGAIVVTQGSTKLTAAGGELDRSTHVAKLRGDVVLRQPGIRMTGSEAELNTQTNDGTMLDARFLDYKQGIRVSAQKLKRDGENVVELERARYTTCPPDQEDWRLDARRVRLDRESGRGVSQHTVLRVADVPVFYTPYLDFPIDDRRKSGFLFPTISSTSSGIDLSVPYYLNLAPNYDATIAPRSITDRGTMLEVEGRYLNRYSNWVITGAELRDDRKEDGEDRWLGAVKEIGSFNQNWSTAIDYTKVSDDDYFRDLGLASLKLRRTTSLTQEADLFYRYSDWYSQVQVQQFQTIDPFITDSYRKLPQLTFGRNAGADNFTLDYSVLAEATRFDHRDSIDDGGTFVTGDRYYVEPGIVFPMRWPAGYIQPEVRLRHVSYQLDQAVPGGTGDESPAASQFQGIVDSGLYFERETEFGDTGYHQTLEPRLYYLYSPYEGQGDQPNFDSSPLTFNYQQLFQPRRFTGHDRLEDFDQLSVGMTSRFIENDTGRESFSASLGQIFYFSDRQITTVTTSAGSSQTVQTQPNSAIAGQLAWEPSASIWSAANVLWDTDESRIDQGNAYIHYDAAHGALYNLGYRYSRADPLRSTLSEGLNQIDASTVLPIAERWRLFARFNYELDDHASLENTAGIEYGDCCWLLRLVYQKAIDGERFDSLGVVQAKQEEVIMLEFQLKGLGSMGQKTDQTLKESIWGYR
ncbi:MAG: LPS-assembly protein LptD [Spongiibacteraceae bacterium]